MSLPPCTCPDPHGPGGCTCARSRQWVGHPHAGPSVLYATSFHPTTGPIPIPLPQIPLTTSHHAPHESHASHDTCNFHAFPNSNIQNNIFPHIPYNNVSPLYPHYFHPSPHVTPVAPQLTPSPSKGRKRKCKAAGQGGGGSKRQWVPAPVVAAPTSTICSVGPTVPVTSLLSDNDPPSSPQLPTVVVQPPTELSQTPLALTQLP